jgi:hypothetical protein
VTCIHLGRIILPPDSTCTQLCLHVCDAKRLKVRPMVDCGEHCFFFETEPDEPEQKRPEK